MELYKRGSKGEIVKQIQKALHLYPDGIFGVITEEAVKEFQKTKGLTVDGIVGPATLTKLIPLRFKKSKRNITEIIVHCTATPEGRAFAVEDVRRWHTTPKSKGGRGWSDIGYHYLIGIHGEIWEGRNVDVTGAHCIDHNTKSIGVCYVGGMDKANKKPKDTRTPQQKASLLSLLVDLKKLYPQACIYGHRDFSIKECPSFDAKNEYKKL